MIETLIVAWVVTAALLVMASGAWVAVRLTSELSDRDKDRHKT